MARRVVLHKYWSFNCPFASMRTSMQSKKFFINTGMNITVKTNNGSTHAEEITPLRTITLSPPNLTDFLTHWGVKRSPLLRLINRLPLDPNKVNLDSSLKWTIFHYSSVRRIYSVAKSRRTFWFYFEIKGLTLGIQVTNFSLFNQRETVYLVIGFRVCSQNVREIDVVVSRGSFKDIITIIWSSHLVVKGGLPVLGFGSSVLSALNLLTTR